MANKFGTVLSDVTMTDGSVFFEEAGTLSQDNTNFTYDPSVPQLSIGSPTFPGFYAIPNNPVAIYGDLGGVADPQFFAVNIRNNSSYGSSDFIVANDLDDGSLTGYYADFGMAGSTYAAPFTDTINQANDVYLLTSVNAGNLNIYTSGSGKKIRFATEGDSTDQLRMDIASDKATFYANKDVELIPDPLIGADWTAAGGWSVTAGELVLASDPGPNTIEPNPPLSIAPGVTYRVIIEASATSGTISYTIGDVPGSMITSGTTTDFITATGTGNLIITGAPSATATITAVSVRALIVDTGDLVVEGGLTLGSGIEVTSGATVMTIDGDGVATFSEIPYVPSVLPTQDYQVANKLYVDTFSQGFIPIPYCDLATTGSNITLSGEQTIDGVMTSSSRVLVKDQTAMEDNGVYISNAGAWTRATDYDTTAEIRIGQVPYIAQGTINSGYRYIQYLFNPATDTLGVDPIGFTILSQIPIFTASDGVKLVGSNFQANYDNVTIGTSANLLQVKNLGISTAKIANNAVTYAKMQAVSTTSKLLGSSDSTTPVQEITIGSGLTLTGTTLTAGGSFANVNLSNLASPTAINQHLLPGVNDTYTLGNSTFKWRQLRLSGGAGISIIADGHITTSTPASGGAFGFIAGNGATTGGTGGAIFAGSGGTAGGAGGSVRAGDGATSFAGGDLIAGSSNGISGTGHGGDVWAGDGGGTSGRGGHVYSGNAFGASDQGGDYIAGTGTLRSGSFITDSTGYFKGGAILLVDGSSNAIQINSPASIVTPYTLIMPNATGTGALTNDGLGNMSWVPGGGGGTPGGSNTQVQYNNSGSFGGITGATSNGTTLTLTSGRATTNFSPSTNDGAALGTTALQFSDLFLASGSVINFNNGNVTLTHSANSLFLAGGALDTSQGGIYVSISNTSFGAEGTGSVNFAALRANTSTSTPGYLIGGAASTSYWVAENPSAVTLTANQSHTRTIFANTSAVTEASSGTHPLIAYLAIKPLTITNGTATTTNAATVYIEGAATGTAVITNNYSLWVAGGVSRFDGNIQTSGSVLSSGTGGLGYSTGAGGQVIQATSKATSVTLNKICGQITTNNANLAANTRVSFVLFNSNIAATDVVVPSIVSGGTVGAYTISTTASSAGQCTFTLANVTGGGLAQALIINFVVIKSVNA